MKLIIGTSLASSPSLRAVINQFTKEGKIFWLKEGNHSIDSIQSESLIHSLDEINNTDSVFILVVSPDTQHEDFGDKKILRVYERKESGWNSDPHAVVIDELSQIDTLLEMNKYPGMTQLLSCYGNSADEFKAMILDQYRDALEAMKNAKGIAVFNAQRLGEFVAKSLISSGGNVLTFIDNGTSKHGTKVADIPVISLAELTDKQTPIIIATTRFSKSIAKQLKANGFNNYLPYPVLSLIDPELYPHEIPYIGIQEDFAQNIPRHLGVFLSLIDDKSREVHDGLIQYRLKYDAAYADAVSDQYDRQYFDEKLISYSQDGIFVDLGGYDGDTVEKYIQFGESVYKKIYLFEPDETILERAKIRLKNFEGIEYVPTGAYSKDGELRFSASGRTNGFFSEVGDLIIPVQKLDSVVKEDPILIKMDIEGSEKDALIGATKTIQRSKPKLAIAAYHFATDLWRLVDVIREINPSYKFYFRHYSETGLESVIYAI
ncbi:FkbM family methyltransferase [Polynucleobacter kasalickyi]|uniref:Methyltransferase, FkbM family n=1 Tax=Polynucleobacter kasalickyi TaxID=1938817 RepID=A0A1W1Y2P7_9BURK|nr:FkbM family methyltransferase [Polynucleobacter kasalickyi]SMC30081.1 methyltransferase, FkbM family [Polynucleobacter kasalickyi]